MFYEATWEDLVDGPDGEPLPHRYLLAPMSTEVLGLVLESDAIWQRWGGKLHAGPAVDASNPGLADDRRRQKELDEVIRPHWESAEWCRYVELEQSGGLKDPPKNGLFWVQWKEFDFPSQERFGELWANRQYNS